MVKIRSLEETTRRYAKRSLQAFLEGRKNLNWIVGVIRSSGVRGPRLSEVFRELQDYGDRKRFGAAYQACQAQGWLEAEARDK